MPKQKCSPEGGFTASETTYPPPVDLEFQELTRNGSWWISNEFFRKNFDLVPSKNLCLMFTPDKTRIVNDKNIQDDTIGKMDLYENGNSENKKISDEYLRMTIGNVRFEKFRHTALELGFTETERKTVFIKQKEFSPAETKPNENADKKQ